MSKPSPALGVVPGTQSKLEWVGKVSKFARETCEPVGAGLVAPLEEVVRPGLGLYTHSS